MNTSSNFKKLIKHFISKTIFFCKFHLSTFNNICNFFLCIGKKETFSSRKHAQIIIHVLLLQNENNEKTETEIVTNNKTCVSLQQRF